MADITFDQLLDEQKKTTSSLNRLGKTLRQQLLGDESQEKDQSRVDAGNKAWQTRQTNIAEASKKVDEITAVVDERQTSWLSNMADKLNFLPFMGKGTESASQDEENKKDEQSFMRKTFGKLGDTFKDGFKSMTDALGKFKDAAMGGLKALLMAAGLFALIEFLQSKTWKKIREWIAENPLEGVMIALIAIAAFFNPLKTLKVIRTLTGNVVLYVKNISKFFLWLGKTLGKGILGSFKLMGKFVKVVAVSLEGYGKIFKLINTGFAKARTGLTAFANWVKSVPAAFKAWTETGGKIAKIVRSVAERIGKIFKVIKDIGSKFARFGGGLARFAGPLGLIISLGTSIFASFTAFKERFAETGSILESIETAVSTFIGTFIGVIPDLIKDGISWVLRKMGEVFGIAAFTDGADVLDSFSFADLITEGLELFIDAVKALFAKASYLAQKFMAALGFGDDPEEDKPKTSKERTERIKKLESDLESGDVEGFNTEANIKKARDELKKLKEEEMRRKRTLAGDSSWKVRVNKYTSDMDQSKPRSLEDVQRGLDLFGEMKGKGSEEQQGMVLKQMQLLEKRKAELEAAKAGGGAAVSSIYQDMSVRQNSHTTRAENIILEDREMAGAVAAGPA